MRMVGENGLNPSTKIEGRFPVGSSSEVLPCLLDGLDRMRPELGPLADELIKLLRDTASAADSTQQGVLEA